MCNKNGSTLVETILAFSIFISCVGFLLSFYVQGQRGIQQRRQNYQQYYQIQNEKESQLWQEKEFYNLINKALH